MWDETECSSMGAASDVRGGKCWLVLCSFEERLEGAASRAQSSYPLTIHGHHAIVLILLRLTPVVMTQRHMEPTMND